MNLITIPREVYAFVENGWRQVVGVSDIGAVILNVDGYYRAFPAKDSFGWDLLWP